MPRAEKAEVDELASALRDLYTLPTEQLRAARPDLDAYLARHFDGLPSGNEFWRVADDCDVAVAAKRAHLYVTQPWLRKEVH